MLTGAALTALPLSAVAMQSARLATGEAITLPVTVTHLATDKLAPVLSIESALSHVNANTLAGDNHFAIGQTVYLFLKRSGDIWYSYAILNALPKGGPLADETLMLRAKVTSLDDTHLTLSFGFDKVSPAKSFMDILMTNGELPIKIGLAVSSDGRSSVAALYAGDQRFAQRVKLKSVLLGRKTTIETNAPPR